MTFYKCTLLPDRPDGGPRTEEGVRQRDRLLHSDRKDTKEEEDSNPPSDDEADDGKNGEEAEGEGNCWTDVTFVRQNHAKSVAKAVPTRQEIHSN